MANGKLMTMREAISRFVKPGDTVFFSGAQHGEPSAAIHEIARQGIDHLTTISILTATLPVLVAEGLVDRLITAFCVQNDEQNFALPRARKLGKAPVIEETSHLGISLALLAGQLNVPFMPTRALLGSNIVDYNENLTKMSCPFTHDSLVAVRAVRPDVGILHCQRADAEGNAQKWGTLCVDVEGLGASEKLIVTAEEIVDSDVIRRDPNLTIVPGFRVSAVVHQPWGAYPWSLGGFYNRDMSGFMAAFRAPESLEAYLRDAVHGVGSWEEYLDETKKNKGEDYFSNLAIKNRFLSAPTITGY